MNVTTPAREARGERELAREARQVAEALLGKQSAIARALPGYQPREPQLQAAALVWRAIRERRHAIIEAGTGTGKSLAALAPIAAYIYKARQQRQEGDPPVRVAVVTALKNLQDQYRHKDLPFLQRSIGFPISFGAQKGKNSYLCLEVFGQHRQANKGQAWAEICDWAERTTTGDLAELPVDLGSPQFRALLRSVSIDADNCPGAADCHYGGQCWAYKAKAKGQSVEILVINYHLLILNALTGGAILPDFEFLVLDEAHKLEEITRSSLEQRLSNRSLRSRVAAAVRAGLQDATASKLLVSGANFLREVEREHGDTVRVGRRGVSFEECSEQLASAAKDFGKALELAEEDLELVGGSAEMHLYKFTALRGALSGGGREVLFVERRDEDSELTLHSSPLDVSGFIRHRVLSTPAVLMSATLGTGGEDPFRHFRDRVGLERSELELKVASPYCYRTQARYLVARYPSGITKPPEGRTEEERARRWCDIITGPAMGLLRMSDARALVLCTSQAVMWELYDRTSRQAPSHWHCQVQGEDSKSAIIGQMREHPACVTFATKSFFEGVDVPGSALSNVIIERIPFPLQGDPVVQGLRRAYGGDGREAFYRYDIPEAILHLLQAVGRLLRDAPDRGIVGLLDPRFLMASYGDRLLKALPGYVEPLPQAEFHKIAGWLAGTGPAPQYSKGAA